MDDNLKQEVELQVRKLFSEDAAKHREYLQNQLTQLKWTAGIIGAVLATAIVYFAGKSYSDLQKITETQVTSQIIDASIVGKIKDRVTVSIDQAISSKETKDRIASAVGEQVKQALGEETAKRLDAAVAEKLKQINSIDLKNSLLPPGSIVAWYGQSNPPDGWHICDGTQGTPNLLNRFIRGAPSNSQPATTGGSDKHTHNVSITLGAGPSKGSDYRWGETPWANAPYPALSGNYTSLTDSQSNLPPYVDVVFIMKLY
jgi:hypothetical protein